MSSGIQEYDVPEEGVVGQPHPHASSELQVTGEAQYTDDIPRQAGELAAALVLSTRSHARIVSMDKSAALALPGVCGIFTQDDVPGHRMHGPSLQDEELLVSTEVTSAGQPIAVVVAEDAHTAKQAAILVKVFYFSTSIHSITIYLLTNFSCVCVARQIVYEDLPSVMTIDEAVAAGSFYPIQRVLTSGSIEAGFAASSHILEGFFCSLSPALYLSPSHTLI